MTRPMICGVLIFALGIIMILSHAKLYEKRLALEEKYEYFGELQLQLGEKRKARMEQQNRQDANSGGLYELSPEDYIIVHVRETSEP